MVDLVSTNNSRSAPETHGRIHVENSLELNEATKDGDQDAVLHARAAQISVVATTTEICVRGRSGPGSGTTFFGCDHGEVVPLR